MPKVKKTASSRVICFVGISGKPGTNGNLEALSEKTLSGKIISQVEAKLRETSECATFFRDNLVQNPPLTDGKLRYPTPAEMKSEWRSFERRLARMKSNVVILLGGLVADFFKERRAIKMVGSSITDGRLLKWAGTDESGSLILAVAHPSYIGVYARKRIEDYIEIIFQAVRHALKRAAA